MTTPSQLILAKLQKLEKETPYFHRMSPNQLQSQTGIPEDVWSEYFQREDVRQRITNKMSEDIEIAHRQAMGALAKQASQGNVQAIKELNQVSGILNQNNNKQIVTHYIPRPKGGEGENKPQ
jgi:hypothetical protein